MNNGYSISKEESKRIDILKLLFIIMVLYVHSFNENVIESVHPFIYYIEYLISNIISRCAVPGFFLISSILLYRKEFKWLDNIKKKVKTILVPYLLLNAFWILFFLIVQNIPILKDYFTNSNNIISKWNFINYLDAFLGFKNGLPILYPLWFMRDLFVLNVFALWIKKIIDKFPKVVLIITCFLWIFVKSTNIFFVNVQAICFFIFGYYYVKNNIHFETTKSKNVIIIPMYLLFIVLNMILNNSFLTLTIHRISMTLGIAFWYCIISKRMFNNKRLLSLTKYTMAIYLFHEMLLTIVEKIAYKIMPSNSIIQFMEYVIAPLIVCVICVIFSIILKKIFPRLYNLITGNR